jgi:predicted ArsR family transcriptional regulator
MDDLRRRLLARLESPASATEIARELHLGRQRVNYHLRRLEHDGLVELVETRQRRGCTERVMRARAAAQDRHAAEHLIVTAGDLVRDVTRMQAAARAKHRRLLTFTLEAQVQLATPKDLERFADALAHAVTNVVREFDAPEGRPYRLMAGAYPAPSTERKP